MHYYFRFLLLLALLWPQPCLAADKIQVVSSFSILADIVKNVGGDLVDVHSIVPPNTDMHGYELRPDDLRRLAMADVFIVNGFGFEPWLDNVQKTSGFKGEVIIASRRVKPMGNQPLFGKNPSDNAHEHAADDGHNHGKFDPHAWHDLDNVRIYVTNITNGLSKIDPANTKTYNQNGIAYRKQITDLISWSKERMRGIPANQRWFVTTHESLRYLARSYRLNYISLNGAGGDDAVTAGHLAQVVQSVRDNKIKAAFAENIVDERQWEVIARETGLVPKTRLYTDALGTEKGVNDSFLALYRYNIEAIAAAMEAGS